MKPTLSFASVIAAVGLCVCGATAQTSAADQLKVKLEGLANQIRNAPTRQEKTNAFDLGANVDTFALALALRKSQAAFVLESDAARVDKQVGGGASNAGSTSLTVKGSVPAILGFAVENGALTSEMSGTTITFRGNPVGIIKSLGSGGFIRSYTEDDATTRFLRRLSFALSFDTNRGSQPGVFTGDRQQISSYAFRLDLLNRRDPRNSAYMEQWDKLIAGDATAVNASIARMFDLLENDPAFLDWHRAATEAVVSATGAEVETQLTAQMEKLRELKISPEIDARITGFITAFNSFLRGRNELLAAVAKGAIVTFEYTNQRQTDQPDLSNFRLIAETGAFRGKADVTGNASITIFNGDPGGVTRRRLRDFQFSGQMDVLLGDTPRIGTFILSFAGKYERMVDDLMMSGGMTADTKGDIGVGQIKLTIPLKGSGLRVPISVTFSNRTELIKEKEVRGNIGVTFDLDSIFARLKP